jgi:transcription termination factor NusB
MSPPSPEDIQEQALKCFSSWVEFGVPIMEGESVILQVFQSLHNPHLFDSAVESLVNVFSHPDSHRFVSAVESLVNVFSHPDSHRFVSAVESLVNVFSHPDSHRFVSVVFTSVGKGATMAVIV